MFESSGLVCVLGVCGRCVWVCVGKQGINGFILVVFSITKAIEEYTLGKNGKICQCNNDKKYCSVT